MDCVVDFKHTFAHARYFCFRARAHHVFLYRFISMLDSRSVWW